MATNSTSTYQGEIVWIGQARSGESKKGRRWTSVDFVVKYTDRKDEVRHVLLNAFGDDLVDKVIDKGEGSVVRVSAVPNARQASDGRWWGSLSAFDISDPKNKRDEDDEPAMRGNEGHDTAEGDLPFK